jgi:hypothetical protein
MSQVNTDIEGVMNGKKRVSLHISKSDLALRRRISILHDVQCLEIGTQLVKHCPHVVLSTSV